MFKIYVVLQNADLNAGIGPMLVKGYFVHKWDADDFTSILAGVQGIPGSGIEVKEIIVNELLTEHSEWNESKLRESALRKLSINEKRALGLLNGYYDE